MDETNSSTRGWWVLRFFLGAVGVGIVAWLALELRSGGVHFSRGSKGITTDMYVAQSPEAKMYAVMTFGGLAGGFLLFALYPKIIYRVVPLLVWIAFLIVSGLRLIQCAERIGP